MPTSIRTPRLFRVGRESQRVLRVGRGTAVLSARPDLIPDTSKLSHVARRRIASPPMAHVERAVAAVGAAVQRWAGHFIDAVMLRVVPDLHRQDAHELRSDATVDQVYESLGDPTVARATLEETFRAVDKASSDDLRVVGVRTGSVVPNADELQTGWIQRNTNLIKAQEDVRARVRKVIEESVGRGRSVDDIRKRLEEQAGYARSRAELTARDQTLKVYGQIQQERQTAAGFTHYVWTTSLDERVREDHAVLDGQVFAWDDPPVVDERTGRREHPGGDYQCRCSAVPYTGDDVGETPFPNAEPQVEPEVQFEFKPPIDPRVEAERQAAERIRLEAEAQRLEAQRLEAQRLEAQRLEAQRLEAQRLEAQRLEAQRLEAQRLEAQRLEAQRLEAQPIPTVEVQTFEGTEPKARVAKMWRAVSQRNYDQMTLPEKTAINAFVHSDFTHLRALQEGRTVEDVAAQRFAPPIERVRELKKMIPQLKEAQRKLKVPNPTQFGTLYRGLALKAEQFEQAVKASDFTFKAASNSTSYSYSTALSFTNQYQTRAVVLRIKSVREGAYVGFVENTNRGETEVVLSNRKFKVTGRTHSVLDDVTILDLEETVESAARADETSEPLTHKLPLQLEREGRFWSDGWDVEFS